MRQIRYLRYFTVTVKMKAKNLSRLFLKRHRSVQVFGHSSQEVVTKQNICAITVYETNVQFTVKGFYIMERNKELFELINKLNDKEIEKFITLFHQELNEECE